MNYTDEQLYDAALAFQAEEAAWRKVRQVAGVDYVVMRKTEVVESGFPDQDAAQVRYVHLRRVAAMKAALAVLETAR